MVNWGPNEGSASTGSIYEVFIPLCVPLSKCGLCRPDTLIELLVRKTTRLAHSSFHPTLHRQRYFLSLPSGALLIKRVLGDVSAERHGKQPAADIVCFDFR